MVGNRGKSWEIVGREAVIREKHKSRDSKKSRDSCLVIRENPLAGLGVALLGVAGGTGKNHVS